VCVLLGDGRSCYVAGAFSLGSVVGHNNGAAFLSVPRTRWWANVAFSLGSVFQKRIIFGGAEIAQQRPAESMAGETSSRPTIAGFEIL
jgi:hypothetical protein